MKKILFLLLVLIPLISCGQATHKSGVIVQDSLISEGIAKFKAGIQVGDSITGSNIWTVDSIVFSATDTAMWINGNRIALGASIPGGGGGVSAFLELTDTPGSYAGQALYFVRVNAGMTALAFIDPATYAVTNFLLVTTLGDYTISDTKANFNTALSDGSFAFDGGAFHDGFSDFLASEHVIWEITGVEDIHDDRIQESSVTQHEAAIDHDALTNTHNLTTDITDHIRHNSGVMIGDSTAGSNIWTADSITSRYEGAYVFYSTGRDSVLLRQASVFNVLDYGADPTGVADATDEIQAAIDAAVARTGGGTVYFPTGKYLISDSLLVVVAVWTNNITLAGDGWSSEIYNSGITSSIRLRNIENFIIKDLYINGDGGSFGAGASNDNGIELWNSHYGRITNVLISHNGGHGILGLNGAWGNTVDNCVIYHNIKDGINMVTDETQDNTGYNGNALSVINSSISNNGGDGIDWWALSLNITGSTIEINKGSGLRIGHGNETTHARGVNVTGSYFENNDSAQIKFVTKLSPGYAIWGIHIAGNEFAGYNSIGDPTMIYHDPIDAVTNSLRNGYIGDNSFSRSGFVTSDYIIPGRALDFIVKEPHIDGGGSFTSEWASIYFTNRIVNVRDYFAIGDGSTDDITAINTALTAADGKVLYFPAGTYVISADITAAVDNVTIRGDGPGASIIYLENGANDIIMTVGGDGWIIEDIGFDGNKDNNTGTCHGIYSSADSALTVRNCEIWDVEDNAISTTGTGKRITIHHNKILTSDIGFFADNGSEYMIKDNWFVACTTPIDINNANVIRAMITGNNWYGCTNDATTAAATTPRITDNIDKTGVWWATDDK